MNIPPGFEGNTGNKVCKLKKAIYGLNNLLGFGLGDLQKS